MEWLTKFLTSKRAVPAHPVRFDTTGWRLTRHDRTTAEWRSKGGDTVTASLSEDDATPLPPLDLEELRALHREAAGRNGHGIVAVEWLHKDGLAAVVAITKPLDWPASYTGALTFLLNNGRYTLEITAREEGMTGVRDAVVTSQLAGHGKLEFTPGEPGGPDRIKGYARDPYDPDYSGPNACFISDDERLNPLFAQHPLTKIRTWIAGVAQSVSIDPVRLPPPSIVEACTRFTFSPPPLLPTDIVASVYGAFRQFDAAERFYAEAAAEHDRSDVDRATCLLMAGACQQEQQAHDRAELSLTRCCALYEGALGPEHSSTGHAKCRLAMTLGALGRVDEAERLLEMVRRISESHAESRDSRLQALQGLASIRLKQDRFAEAATLLEEAIAVCQQTDGSADELQESVLRQLAFAFKRSGELERMAEASRRADALKAARERRERERAANLPRRMPEP